MLAPIGLTVYSRLNHLKHAIDALKKNSLARDSSLHIFSDAPRKGDEEAVSRLRDYIKSIDGFDDVVVTERKQHSRINNNRGGQQYLLEKHGKMIWMAEDIVPGAGFLEFMNYALEYYRDEEKVISIAGYTPDIELPTGYEHDVFFLRRFNAWGFGIWSRKFSQISQKLDKNEYHMKIRDRQFYKQLVSNGQDIPGMVDREVNGVIDALDVKIMYQQASHEWYTVYPRKSLVQNIGHDGSGLHCGVTDKFHHDELWDKTSGFKLPHDIQVDNRIVSANRRFRRLGVKGSLAEHMRRLRAYLP
jgi:hypothetical protein